MNRKKNTAVPDASLIPLRFVFGHPKTNQTAGHTANRASGARTRERGYNRAGCDEGSNPRNGQSSNARQPSQNAAYHRTGTGAGGGAFWSLRCLLETEVLIPDILRKQNRDIGIYGTPRPSVPGHRFPRWGNQGIFQTLPYFFLTSSNLQNSNQITSYFRLCQLACLPEQRRGLPRKPERGPSPSRSHLTDLALTQSATFNE